MSHKRLINLIKHQTNSNPVLDIIEEDVFNWFEVRFVISDLLHNIKYTNTFTIIIVF